MLTQISIYTENRKGVLDHITGIFTDHQINVDAMVVNDSAEFGTARFIVDKADEAVEALKENGYIVRKSPVVGVFLKDNYGELNKLLGEWFRRTNFAVARQVAAIGPLPTRLPRSGSS